MSGLLNRLLTPFIPQNMRSKFYRYLAVSAFNIPLTQLLLWILNPVLGLEAIYANLTAVSLVAAPAFFLYKKWVWSISGPSHIRKEVLPFWATALSGLGISTFAVWLATLWWDSFWAVALGNIAGFGLVWIGRFIIFEVWLFTHREVSSLNASSLDAPSLDMGGDGKK